MSFNYAMLLFYSICCFCVWMYNYFDMSCSFEWRHHSYQLLRNWRVKEGEQRDAETQKRTAVGSSSSKRNRLPTEGAVHSVASEWNGKWTHFLPVSLLTFNNPTSHSADLLVLDSDWICNKRLKETDGRNGERDGLTFILGGVEAVGRCLVWWRRPWRNLRWTRRICWNEEKSRWRRRRFDRADEKGS